MIQSHLLLVIMQLWLFCKRSALIRNGFMQSNCVTGGYRSPGPSLLRSVVQLFLSTRWSESVAECRLVQGLLLKPVGMKGWAGSAPWGVPLVLTSCQDFTQVFVLLILQNNIKLEWLRNVWCSWWKSSCDTIWKILHQISIVCLSYKKYWWCLRCTLWLFLFIFFK